MRMLSKFIVAGALSAIAATAAQAEDTAKQRFTHEGYCLLYTSPSPRDS